MFFLFLSSIFFCSFVLAAFVNIHKWILTSFSCITFPKFSFHFLCTLYTCLSFFCLLFYFILFPCFLYSPLPFHWFLYYLYFKNTYTKIFQFSSTYIRNIYLSPSLSFLCFRKKYNFNLVVRKKKHTNTVVTKKGLETIRPSRTRQHYTPSHSTVRSAATTTKILKLMYFSCLTSSGLN